MIHKTLGTQAIKVIALVLRSGHVHVTDSVVLTELVLHVAWDSLRLKLLRLLVLKKFQVLILLDSPLLRHLRRILIALRVSEVLVLGVVQLLLALAGLLG